MPKQMRLSSAILRFSWILFAARAVPVSAAPQVASYEIAPPFRAAEVLSGIPLKAPTYTIDPSVGSDGFDYIVKVRSPYGDYEITGSRNLPQLLFELNALKSLEQFTESTVFVEAVKQSGIGVVTAPIRAVEKVYDAAANPDQTWKTVKKAPQGLWNVFQGVGEAVSTGASAAGQALGITDGDSGSGSGSGKAIDAAQDGILHLIGYSKRAMSWYERYKLDPYTDNKPLRDKIARIAQVETAVGVGFKFVPGIVGIPGLGLVNTALDRAQQLSLYDSPEALLGKQNVTLKQMGVSAEDTQRFLNSPVYTPTLQTYLVDALATMTGVHGRPAFIRAAATASDLETARYYRNAAQYLAREYTKNHSIVELMDVTRIPAALLKDGRVLVPLPFDYVTWNQLFGSKVHTVRDALRKDQRVQAIELRVAGRVSPRCREELGGIGVTVVEKVAM